MSALKLIVKREYLSRITKRSFILMTILMPLIIVGFVMGTVFLSQIKDSEVKKIVVIDETGKYAPHLKNSEHYTFQQAQKEAVTKKNKDEDENPNFGTLMITADLTENPQAVTLYSEKQPPSDLMMYLKLTFGSIVKHEKLEKLSAEGNVDKATIAAVQQITEAPNNVNITTIRLDEDGNKKETSNTLATAIGSICTFLMYIFILSYGAMVMQGVIEEKSNRIVEVMVSSVRPFDLMMGKIIGISLVGLTQLAIWIGISIGLFMFATSTFMPSVDMDEILTMLKMSTSINWFEIGICFFLFFIGGYLMYASLFAMFGSAVDNPQDAQQFMMPITMIFIFAFYAGIFSVNNPDGPLAFWCSIIPLTSPIVMMVRIPFGVPLWEIILSVSILYITAILVVKMAAKIYRVGILMYGKKPDMKELIKWMRYK